jgi:hypothetical protein
MPRHKFMLLLGLILFHAGATCWAGEPNQATKEEVATPSHYVETVELRAWIEPGEFVGELQMRRFYLSAGTNRFGFMLAPGLVMSAPTNEKVMLAGPQFEYFVTLRFIAPGVFSCNEAACRQRVEQLFPEGIVLDQTGVNSLGRQGFLFKLQWKSLENVQRAVAAAFVPTAAGVLEIVLSANPAKASEGQDIITDLLERGRSNESGRLNMPIIRPIGYN